jgi:hypothetical protein
MPVRLVLLQGLPEERIEATAAAQTNLQVSQRGGARKTGRCGANTRERRVVDAKSKHLKEKNNVLIKAWNDSSDSKNRRSKEVGLRHRDEEDC